LNIRKKAKRVTKPNPRATGSLDVHFGEKLRARRRMMVPKLTQAALADKLNVTFQQIQKYEKGKKHERGHDGADRGGTKCRCPVFFR
jgi:hypothetical protein